MLLQNSKCRQKGDVLSHRRRTGRPALRLGRRSLAPRRRPFRGSRPCRRSRRLPSGPGARRREALWAIKALRDEPLPLFAAASAREAEFVPEVSEPAVTLRPMTAGGEVVEDYGHVGLTLRAHPLSFLREDLRHQRIATCAESMAARDGRWLEAAGTVLVRQRPGSAKGVTFVTLEDETGIANLVIWAKVLEANRRAILSAGMMAAHGRVQREGDVVHLVAQRITDLSADLASVGSRGAAFPHPHGRDDHLHRGVSGRPDLPRGSIRVRSRDFH